MAEIDFMACVKQGVDKAMEECELTIGMTLKEAVEKQIPKKPKIKITGTTGWNTTNYCPACDKEILSGNYCLHCGQALDWGQEDERV